MVKKSFPKIKKSLKWFLTDESWKVTKKDVLWISVWATVISWLGTNEVAAMNCWAHTSSTSHNSWCTATSQWSISWYTSGWHVSTTLRWGSFSIKSHPQSAHASGINTPVSKNVYGVNRTLYAWSHLSYNARGSYTSQSSITWYTHSSWSTHNSSMAHVSWGQSCP